MITCLGQSHEHNFKDIMTFAPVAAGTEVPDGITETDSIHQMLHWCGFTAAGNRNAIFNDSIGSFDDIKMMTAKDVTAMQKDFGSRQTAARINFGVRRTKKLTSMLHFVHDFHRVSESPTIVGLTDVTFSAAIDTALTRADVRHTLTVQSDTSAKNASPGPLINERKWKEWETKFENYLSTMIGSNGVPLSYIIRENDNPPTDQAHLTNFTSKTIECAPLQGAHYEADRYTVQQQLISFTTGQSSEDWLKSTKKFADGRRSMIALRAHFSGEGNASRNIAETERLRDSLFYKNERAMPFETFLTNLQKMFNIFDKEGEAMEEDAKLRTLFKKIQHVSLLKTVEALKVQQRTSPTAVTYTVAANHISAAVSELPEYISRARDISSVGRKPSSIYKDDGSIKTGEIDGWPSLSYSDKQKVWNERKKLGIRYNPNPKNKKYIRKQDSDKNSASNANHMKQLTEQNKIYKRKIKALKVSFGDGEESKEDEDTIDAGDQFGGKASKKNKSEH